MTPNTVASRLMELGIDWASITDHNTARNVRVFSQVWEKNGIRCLPGLEVQTIEDVHILCYLPDLSIAERFGLWVESYLPSMEFDPEQYGYPLLVDENDQFIKTVDKPFFLPVSLELNQVVHELEKVGGIGVYAHIDRSMGVIEQLGFLPPDPSGVGCEIYQQSKIPQYKPATQGRPLLSSSDAHHPDAMVEAKMIIRCKSRSFEEFRLAFFGIRERSIRLCI